MPTKIALPLRDTLRFIGPAIMAAAELYAVSDIWYMAETNKFGTEIILSSALAVSILLFLAKPHGRWLSARLWKEWNSGLKSIEEMQPHSSNRKPEILTRWSPRVYEIWAEAFQEPSLREHLQYRQGLFYMATSIFWISFISALIFGIEFACLHHKSPSSTNIQYAGCTLAFIANIMLARFSHRSGNDTAGGVLREGLLLMASRESQEKLTQLWSAADKVEGHLLHHDVERSIARHLERFAPYASVRYNSEPRNDGRERTPRDVVVNIRASPFEPITTAKGQQYSVVRVEIGAEPQQATPSDFRIHTQWLVGASLENGNWYRPHQAEILQAIAKSAIPLSIQDKREVYVEFSITEAVRKWLDYADSPKIPMARGPRHRVVSAPFDEAEKQGLVSPATKETCEKYGLNTILLGHNAVVGPSSPLAYFLESVKSDLPVGLRFADPFPGTGLVGKIFPDRTILPDNYDPETYDAWSWGFESLAHEESVVLVVDAMYHQVTSYLSEVVKPKISGNDCLQCIVAIIVQTGDIWDISWNIAVEAEMTEMFGKQMDVKSSSIGTGNFVLAVSREGQHSNNFQSAMRTAKSSLERNWPSNDG